MENPDSISAQKDLRSLIASCNLPLAQDLPITLLRGGNTNSTYLLGNRFIAKIGDALWNETRFLSMAATHGIHVPKLIASNKIDGKYIIIMEYLHNTLSGRDAILSKQEWHQVGIEAGRQLRRIHALDMQITPTESIASLRSFLTLPKTQYISQEIYQEALEAVLIYGCNQLSFVHGDFTPHNLLIHKETHELIAIIDPSGRIQEAPPYFDYVRAKISRWSTSDFFEGLHTGYNNAKLDWKILTLFEWVLSGHYAEIYAMMGDEISSQRLQKRFAILTKQMHNLKDINS